MSNINDLFDKIFVNGSEIDIEELIENNGIYHLEDNTNTYINVQYKFKNNSVIPSGLFNNNGQIKKIKIGKNITTIENNAFSGNYNMSYAYIPETITTIGTYAFNLTNLSEDIIEHIQTIDNTQVVNIVYSDEEAISYNYNLPNAWKYNKIKYEGQEEIASYWILNNQIFDEDPTYEISNSYDYIHDESSWNYSYTYGGLKQYYEDYPNEDRWNSNENRYALESDKINDEWPEYCLHSWLGTINAPNAKLPWIVPHFDTDVNSKILLKYNNYAVSPWNNATRFGIEGSGYKYYGIASIPEEFNDDTLKITNIDGSGSYFDINKFNITMIHGITGEERNLSYYEYIHDESSWNNSYENGILKLYYNSHPYEDLWNTYTNSIATFNDKLYTVNIYSDITWTECIEENIQYITEWYSEKAQLITNLNDHSKKYYINVNAIADNLYHEVFVDPDMTESTGRYLNIVSVDYPNFIHCWEGTYNAPNAKLPWIIPYFNHNNEINNNVILRFNYEGLDSIYPWGYDHIFGNGLNHKQYGVASIPEEFNDDTLKITNIDGSGSYFDINKFQMILEHQGIKYSEGQEYIEPIYYSNSEIDEYNSKLEGAISAGELKK